MNRRRHAITAAVFGATMAMGCGGEDATAPTAVARGALVADAETDGQRTPTGWWLTLALRLRETGGVPVTVHSANIALLDGAGAVQLEQTVDKPVGGTNRLAPSEQLRTTVVPFEFTDGRPFPSGVRATVRYTDDNGHDGMSQVTAKVEPLPPFVTVFGVVRYGPTGMPIAGATVVVADGAHDGRTVTTDGNGYYSLAEVSGRMRVWFFALGMTGTSVDIAPRQDTRLDVDMLPPRRPPRPD